MMLFFNIFANFILPLASPMFNNWTNYPLFIYYVFWKCVTSFSIIFPIKILSHDPHLARTEFSIIEIIIKSVTGILYECTEKTV